jgi:hypothetical protein
LENLEEVTLNDMHLTVDEMAKYMFLKSIRRVSVESLRQRPPPTLDTRRSLDRAGKSPIMDLNIGPNIVHLPEHILVCEFRGLSL